LPCFGAEPCPDQIWGVAEYAGFVKQKIQALRLNQPIVLGHSFGGQVAAYLAATSPQSLSRLILCGASALRYKRGLKRAVFKFIARIGKIFFRCPLIRNFSAPAKKFLYRLADSPDYQHTSGRKREIFKKVTRQDLTNELKSIVTPTLIIWGTKDGYVDIRTGRKISRLVKDAKFIAIPGGKHGLHLQMPEKLYSIVNNFRD
jgi:pimeloyl-ACP methyl ester carboxylesterase